MGALGLKRTSTLAASCANDLVCAMLDCSFSRYEYVSATRVLNTSVDAVIACSAYKQGQLTRSNGAGELELRTVERLSLATC